MTLDQLKVLLAIVDEGSFRSAAETLHRAQSAISYAVKNLEAELGFALFDRETYRPRLTESGKAIYNKARHVLKQAEELSQLGEHISRGHESEIRLAINAICPFEKLTQVINHFSRRHPAVQIMLAVENLGGSIEQLLDGNADIALAESFEWDSRLEGKNWHKIQFIPVAASDFEPLRIAESITSSTLMRYAQIIVADSSRHSQRKTVGVLKDGLQWTVNDFSIKRQLLTAGSGWGFMPEHMVADELATGKLIALDSPDISPMIVDIFLFRRADKPSGPLTTQLWEQLKNIQQV